MTEQVSIAKRAKFIVRNKLSLPYYSLLVGVKGGLTNVKLFFEDFPYIEKWFN